MEYGDWVVLTLLLGHFQVFFARRIVSEMARAQQVLASAQINGKNSEYSDTWVDV